MKSRPPNPVPTALIVGALGAIALAALAVWFLAMSPADPVAANNRPATAESPATGN